MNNIDVISYLCIDDDNINYRSIIEKVLTTQDHRTIIEYALHCATDLDKYYDTKKYPSIYKESTTCLDLVAKWLVNPNAVPKKELEAVAHAAYAAHAAANAAAYAANAAAYAAHAAAHAAAYAAHAEAYAAHAANAAHAAAHAAYAAAHAAADAITYNKVMCQHLLYLLKLIKYDVPSIVYLFMEVA